MTSKANVKRDKNWNILALVVLAVALWQAGPAMAADEPDLIFRRSTVFKWLSPNDKLATYGVDDPEVEGVACHFTVPERGGVKGWLGLAEKSRIFRWPAARSARSTSNPGWSRATICFGSGARCSSKR